METSRPIKKKKEKKYRQRIEIIYLNKAIMEEEAKDGGSIPLVLIDRGLEHRLDRAKDLRARRRVEVRRELS